VVVGFGGVAAEKDVAIIVDGGDVDAVVAEDVAAVAASGSPEGIEDDLQVGFLDGGEVDEFAEALEVGGLDVDFVEFLRCCLGMEIGIRGQGSDGGFDLLCRLGECGRAVGGGELDAVVFGRVVGGGEVDRAGSLVGDDGIGDE